MKLKNIKYKIYILSLHKPDLGRIRRQNRASAEIVGVSGEQIDRLAAACIEMSSIRIIGSLNLQIY